MRLAILLMTALLSSAAPAEDGRDLATQLPAEIVDCVVATRLDASRAEELLKGLFERLRMHPRYALAVFPLPGDDRARLVFIRGKDADVVLVRKALAAMDEAASLGVPEAERKGVMRVESGAAGPAEMERRIVAAAARAGLPLADRDFFIYPEGPAGSLFFIGAPGLAARVTELSGGLAAAPPPAPSARARAWLLQIVAETAKSFAGLLSTAASAASLLLLHAILCRLPFLGKRYRRSFRLFWEKLFASFKGKDLAWEIIRAAAELGVAASTLPVPGGLRAPAGGAGDSARERALSVARAYVAWRGIDPDATPIRGLLDAAVDAEASRAARAAA
jgi:hypothetical protein